MFSALFGTLRSCRQLDHMRCEIKLFGFFCTGLATARALQVRAWDNFIKAIVRRVNARQTSFIIPIEVYGHNDGAWTIGEAANMQV